MASKGVIRQLFSVSFFSAPGFRLFSVNPGCTALATEQKIYKSKKRTSTAEEIPPRTPSFYENADKYAICGYIGKK